jgi:hypothetical protein
VSLPGVPYSRLLEAMERFDTEYRGNGAWAHWQDDRSHKFAIAQEGRLYPVKMIVSLATGVPRSEFSGGIEAGQAGRYTRDAGLNVVPIPGRDSIASEGPSACQYWAVCADPDRYRIADVVRDLDHTTWTTKGRPLGVGDRLALWQLRDRSGRRGIVALAEVTEGPTQRPAPDPLYWIDPAGSTPEERVGIPIVRLPQPMWLDGLHDAALRQLSVSRARGGTVFRASTEQWSALLEAVGGWPSSEPRRVAEDAIRASTRPRHRGQARGLGPTERREVELRAMRLAM